MVYNFLILPLFSVFFFLFADFQSSPQKQKPDPEFRSPVNFPITLAGSFGEIRRNHFHSGIDIRTAGEVGKPVYAIADGSVSRINIAAAGFGKALYIAHPDGHTSLYGHLLSYAGNIAAWVKKQQYEKESFTMDTEIKPGILKVKKGDLIAYSGNSGSSGGPHLHFEIRDTKTQEILDPLDFGFMNPDQSYPKISLIKVFPKSENAMINLSAEPKIFYTSGGNGKFTLKGADTLQISGSVIFGIETNDQAEGGFSTGVHEIMLKVDGETVFAQKIDRFAFAETRYVNSIIDYPAFVREKRKIQRSYVAPNNKMGVFEHVRDQGICHFNDTKIHTLVYLVQDAFGNNSKLEFYVKSHPPVPGGARPAPEYTPDNSKPVFTWKNDNNFNLEDLKFKVPSEAVYEDFTFNYTTGQAITGLYSRVHELHNALTPLHTWCDLEIRCTNLPSDLASKALVVSLGAKNQLSSAGGKYKNGWISTRIREFGRFAVAVDTKPPDIVAVNIRNNKKINKQTSIRMRISDNLSGIDTYRGTLNGHWILMDYDAKSRMLVYTFDEHLKPGKNNFRLVVTDAVGNSAEYKAALVR